VIEDTRSAEAAHDGRRVNPSRLPYTGREFLESLDDGREVWIYGERVKRIAEHPRSVIVRGCSRVCTTNSTRTMPAAAVC
jgi:hypothetical protein